MTRDIKSQPITTTVDETQDVKDQFVHAVTDTSPTDAWLVSDTGNHHGGLSEHWNGTNWKPAG